MSETTVSQLGASGATDPASALGKDKAKKHRPRIQDRDIDFCRRNKIPIFKARDVNPKPYELSVATANRLYRFARPDVVIMPESADHVRKIIQLAKLRNFQVTIKSNGHSYAGHSTRHTGISIDLRRLNIVNLDVTAKIVTMESGCQWGQVYKEMINKGMNGYVVNGGRCPNVGVGGFILGAGLGPFTRTFGMGSDSLLEVDIVTAEGELITVKASDDKDSKNGQLFWALSGAGGGSFGVVTQVKMKVLKLSTPDGKTVVAGRSIWYYPSDEQSKVEKLPTFIDTMNKFYTTDWPKTTTIDSTWVCEPSKSKDFVRFLVYHDGLQASFNDIINTSVEHPVLKKMLIQRSMSEASTRFLHETLVDQWAEETERAKPNDTLYHIYSSFVFDNDTEKIEKITVLLKAAMSSFRASFPNEDILFSVTWIHSGGNVKAAENLGKGAFYWRDAVYHVYPTIEWKDKWLEKAMRSFLSEVVSMLRPFSLDGVASYINFPDGALRKDLYETAYYGNNVQKLREVKKLWDPTNFFEFEQSVQLPDGNKPIEKKWSATSAEVDMATIGSNLGIGLISASVNFPPVVARTLAPGFVDAMKESAINSELIPSAGGAPQVVRGGQEDIGYLTDKLAREHWDDFIDDPDKEIDDLREMKHDW